MNPDAKLVAHSFDATFDGRAWAGTYPGVVEVIANRVTLPWPLRMSIRVTGSGFMVGEKAIAEGVREYVPSIQSYAIGLRKGTRVVGEILTEKCVEPFGTEVFLGMIIVAERKTKAMFERVGKLQ